MLVFAGDCGHQRDIAANNINTIIIIINYVTKLFVFETMIIKHLYTLFCNFLLLILLLNFSQSIGRSTKQTGFPLRFSC